MAWHGAAFSKYVRFLTVTSILKTYRVAVTVQSRGGANWALWEGPVSKVRWAFKAAVNNDDFSECVCCGQLEKRWWPTPTVYKDKSLFLRLVFTRTLAVYNSPTLLYLRLFMA